MPESGEFAGGEEPAFGLWARLRAAWRLLCGIEAGLDGTESGSILDRIVDVLESLPVAVAVFDENERLQLFNSRYQNDIQSQISDILRPGLPFETMVRVNHQRGSQWRNDTDSDFDENIEIHVARALARHRQLPISRDKQLNDGRWIKIIKQRTKDGRTVAIYTDITDLKIREARLRQQDERLAQVIHASHDGFWDHDLVTGDVWYSQRLKELLGYVDSQFPATYQTFVDHLHPEERDGVLSSIEKHLKHRLPFDIEHRMRTRKGDYRWFNARGMGRFDEDGKAVAVSGSVHDITERRKSLRNLRDLSKNIARARDEAESASQVKSDFLATMSHEIRTPLNGILGMVTLLLSTNQTLEQRRYAESLHSVGAILLSLVNDILDFSKMEAGRLELAFVEFDLAEEVQGVIDMLLPEARQKGIELTKTVSSDFDGLLVGDPDRLRQVMLNLAGNAVKFTESGSVFINVTMDSKEDGIVMVRFAVKDTGIGVPEEQRSAIFERFIQADSCASHKFGGTGLGLAICRQLVEVMEGEIGMESETGKGSTFWFTAPLVLSGEKFAAVKPPDHPSYRKRLNRPLHILLAEDNSVNQMYISTLLRKEGHNVTIVENGEQAVSVVKKYSPDHFDVVLMDVHMPKMDGLEAHRLIRALPGERSKLPVIALTANAMSGDREHYLREGMNEYVSKPIDVDRLSDALARVTGQDVMIDAYHNRPSVAQNGKMSKKAESALAEFIDSIEPDRDDTGRK